jgi:Immunity protein 70
MGLYLTVFDDGEELDGVEIGSYDDFAFFRDAVVWNVEGGTAGASCPILILHSDCDGQWSPDEAASLETELEVIARKFADLPPVSLGDGWKPEVAKMFGIRPANLADCFFDVDGELLLNRLIGLAKLSQERNLPILFQ